MQNMHHRDGSDMTKTVKTADASILLVLCKQNILFNMQEQLELVFCFRSFDS